MPSRSGRNARSTTLALGAVVALVACLDGGEKASAASDTPRKKISIAIQPFMSHAPVLLAYADSFFAEEGLDVEFIKVANSTEAIPALIKGDVDVYPASANPGLFNAMARGIAVRMVTDRGYFDPNGCTFAAIAVPRGRLASVRANPRQVKRVTIERQYGTLYLIAKAFEVVGLSLDSLDTKIVPPLPEAEALGNGRLDAAFVSEPWITRLVSGGQGEVWIRLEHVLPHAQHGYVFFGPSLLRRDPDAGRRFLIAYRRGVAKLLEGKTPENVAALAKETGDTPELVRQQCWPTLRADGRVDLASTHEFQLWLQRQGLVTDLATPEQMWDSSFLVYADSILKRRGSVNRQ
jgi:NitT/TauT family transport system substrate-binding protein